MVTVHRRSNYLPPMNADSADARTFFARFTESEGGERGKAFSVFSLRSPRLRVE
jgi:hypothetical protein